jgi:fumarate hydratase class II
VTTLAETARTETDSLGSIAIDAERYWVPQTEHARRLFQIGTERFPPNLIRAVGLQKQAPAQAFPNSSCRRMDCPARSCRASPTRRSARR